MIRIPRRAARGLVGLAAIALLAPASGCDSGPRSKAESIELPKRNWTKVPNAPAAPAPAAQ